MIFQQPKVNAARRTLEQLDPKPRVLVELGGYVGKSAIAWGDMLQGFHADRHVKVFSMELEPDLVRIIRDFVETAGLADIIEVIEGQSGDSLRNLKMEKGIEKIDVLFLDHWEKFYLSDLKVCEELRLLRVGSVVVADNTDMPGAPDYLRYVEEGGEGCWRYRCETVLVDEPQGSPVSFSLILYLFSPRLTVVREPCTSLL